MSSMSSEHTFRAKRLPLRLRRRMAANLLGSARSAKSDPKYRAISAGQIMRYGIEACGIDRPELE
jgi:hypothetical protein